MTLPPAGESGAGGGVLVVACGEHVPGPVRTRLERWARSEAPATTVRVRDNLCAAAEQAGDFLPGRSPHAVVVACCSPSAALAGGRRAVRAGVDGARCAAVSLGAVATARTEPEREQLAEVLLRAAIRRAEALASEPPAGGARMQLGGSLDRRGLLRAWRDEPRRAAVIDTSRCLGAACGACVRACPRGALITAGGQPHVNLLRCSGCGACTYACPAGALSVPGAALDPVVAQLQTALDGGVRAVVFTCEHAPDRAERAWMRASAIPAAGVIVPCAAVLGPGLLLGLLAAGCDVGVATCRHCPESATLEGTAGLAAATLGALGARELAGRLAIKSPPTQRSHDLPGPLATGPAPALRLAARDPAATAAAVRHLACQQGAGPGRDGNGSGSGSASAGPVVSDRAAGGIVAIRERSCSLCGACALACPAGALGTGAAGKVLEFDAAACVACGRCAAACPEHALSVTRGVDIGRLRAGRAVLCRPGQPARCPHCGAPVADGPMRDAAARRLASRGASRALIQALRTCRACGAGIDDVQAPR